MQFFIADDHELIRESLAHLFREAWGEETEVVGLPDFTDLLMALADHGPGDVVIMDLKMPGMQGAHSVEILKARYPGLPVLVLSGLFRHADVLAAMNAGADGFVSKASGGEVLLEAVRLVLAGGTYPMIPAGPSSPCSEAGRKFDPRRRHPGGARRRR
jgi:DNA-binding NarL/FixJ family response regulator